MRIKTLIAVSASLTVFVACQSAIQPIAEAEPAIQDQEVQAVPLIETAKAINALMRQYHYNPGELDSDTYRKIEADTLALAAGAENQEAFIDGFKALWADGPFSHVTLRVARSNAADTAAFLDQMRVGEEATSLEWRGNAAILTVNTMMGQDTIEAIDAHYATIRERGAEKLIIDLRQNGGGAFAVVPLIENAITESFDAGGFVSQPWNAQFDRVPVLEDIQAVEPWTGWSIRSFWEDAANDALTRIQFSPRAEPYTGPIYVLTSQRTASAAEMAADAFKASGRATLIGERTAGQMLSQKMFDVPGGLILSLPIADYYSTAHGRIEGQGVAPDIETSAEEALEFALR
ncbi:S41 family peptidase [Hyphomonas sp. FCG-A18]|uniref:S41 family peptidase n=1 Tax=Hyphomonas sp. FCG-A18 TaxID=3080019 RepID=UPI002B3240C7|nr:S41 family peptidase [Hyphomonas sp. FCG-A18]